MKLFLFICLILFIPTVGKSQLSGNSELVYDSITYNENQQFYLIQLEGPKQMIFFNSATYDNNRPISILIENNTENTVALDIKSLQSSKMYCKENSGRILEPGESYSFSPIFGKLHFNQSPFLSSHFSFQYSPTNHSKNSFVLRLSGTISLGNLEPFVVQLPPISLQEHQKYVSKYAVIEEEIKISDTVMVSTKHLNNDTLKIPYTISTGQFNGEDLYTGKIDYYNSKDELIVSKLIVDGLEQNGYLYKGRLVNLNDSLGKKEGKWIEMRRANLPRNLIDSDKLYEGIWHLTSYQAGVRVDTGFFYHETGILNMIFVSGDDTIPPKRIFYHENGNISQMDLFKPNAKYTFIIYKSVYYPDSIDDCITKRETYFPNQSKVNFSYEYVNCQLYSKTSVKEKYFVDEGGIETHEETIVIVDEGKTRTITYAEKIDPIPTLQPIPYTVEIGNFDPTETFLINGIISYYSSGGTLIESNNVIDSAIVK